VSPDDDRRAIARGISSVSTVSDRPPSATRPDQRAAQPVDERPIRVLVADDQVVAVRGIASYFESLDVVVCGAVDDPFRLRSAAAVLVPDVIVAEPSLGPPGTCFEQLAVLVGDAEQPSARVVVLTSDLTPYVAQRAADIGCLGIVPKTASIDALHQAVRAVAAGERWYHPRAVSLLIEQRAVGGAARSVTLTPRELDVLEQASEGWTNREIGERLGIGAETVKTHLGHVQVKLAARDRTHAVAVALRRGLLD
jgi:DNA-binding NarL/FixJ family response regulator